MSKPVLWEELSWEQIANLRDSGMDLVILPVGASSIWEISSKIHQFYHQEAANFHANCAETSVMLALRPDLVQLERAVDEPDRSARCFFAYTVNKESVHGAVGSPSLANSKFGQEILDACINELSEQLQRALLEKTPLEEMPTVLP
jgi:creatinine amidohydrolase